MGPGVVGSPGVGGSRGCGEFMGGRFQGWWGPRGVWRV